MDETAVVNAVKVQICFVPQDFPADLRVGKDKENSSLWRAVPELLFIRLRLD